ncbi:MAG: glycosyltransferase [Pyrinomonadaceae bacterium]
MMPPKSIHITNYYHPSSGGISRAYDKLLEAADRHRRYVRLIVPGRESSVQEVGEYGRIYFVEAAHAPVFDKRYRLLLPWKAYTPKDSPIRAILRDEQPDIVEIGEKYSLSLLAGLIRRGSISVFEKRPMLVQATCERMDDNIRSFVSERGVFQWFARGYMSSYVVPMYDFHLANSDYTAEEILRANTRFAALSKMWRSPKVDLAERVFVNQRGVNKELFSASRRSPERRAIIRDKYELPENSLILLYAGRVSPEKNVMLLPEMMQQLSKNSEMDIRLLIAGAGPSLDPLIEESGKVATGKVISIGHVSDRQELADLYANCDAFVHPNPREPFGQAPMEAMASGLAVVGPDSGGILSYADDSNAWLATATPEAFADSILAMLSDLTDRKRRVERALKTAQGYSWEASTANMFSIYDEMYARFTSDRSLFDYLKGG